MNPEAGNHPQQGVAEMLGSVQDQLTRIEQMISPEAVTVKPVKHSGQPAWLQATDGEQRILTAAAVAVAIALQLVLPRNLAIHPLWLLPSLEALLLVGLIVANPRRIDRTSKGLRTASILLIALISLANAWSSAELIKGLVNGTEGDNAALLLARGASVYVTNILVFALWYWEWDRGGPVARAQGLRPHPDFLFPQMTQPQLAPPGWEPNFIDYLYVSFTNVTAFSPTDDADVALGQDAHVGAVGDSPIDRRLCDRPSHQHSQIGGRRRPVRSSR